MKAQAPLAQALFPKNVIIFLIMLAIIMFTSAIIASLYGCRLSGLSEVKLSLPARTHDALLHCAPKMNS